MIFETWSKCRAWLLPAIELTYGEFNEDDILKGLIIGEYLLWPGERSAVVTEIVQRPRMKTLHWFLVGGDLDELLMMEEKIAAWAKAQGCHRVTCSGRKGWERVLTNYKPTVVGLYRDL